ncbi:MAG: ABC transporter substrate-binding protein, partial [Pseudomonadota bacterium]
MLGRLVAPGSVFDCLAEIGPDGGLMGELAESWEPQNGGAVWAVTLRDGAEFHDGRSFQADDAVVSLRYHMAAAADRLGIVSVRKAKRLQIVITLEAPDPGFPFLLSDPSLMMLPADDPVGALRHGIGTGLYRIKDAHTGMRLERVAAHYKDGRAGWFEALELVGIEDAKERTRGLLAGRFDAVAAPDPGVQRKHGGKQRFIDVATPSRRHLQIRCRGDNAGPLAAALKLGLDRYAVLNEFLGGRGRVAGDTPISSEPPEQDTARARYLLAKAGVDRA